MKVARRKALLIVLLAVGIGIAVGQRKRIFQYVNVRAILAHDLDGRLIPHRINRIEKLDGLLRRGIRSMEIDVLFRRHGTGGYFEVGHDEGDARSVRLGEFLERMRPYRIRKIWLDMKNVGPDNVRLVDAELRRLDSIYGLADIAIVECYTPSPAISTLRASGFHTSYYLPDAAIIALAEASDHAARARQVELLATRVRSQAVRAVSFRLTQYPVVKTHLEPFLPPDVCYHGWDSVELRSWGAISDLQSSDYFGDARLVTIIYRL